MSDTTSATIEIIGPRDLFAVRTAITPAPTETQYVVLQQAFDHFNATLFKPLLGVCLPPLLITLQRQRGAYGYYSADKFASLHGDAVQIAELALNPAHFHKQSMRGLCATLAHEMAHHFQCTFGEAPRRGYHDRAWAAVMKRIGLQPSDTGEIGGRETGAHMSHVIVENGPFALAYEAFERTGAVIAWGDALSREADKSTGPAGPTKPPKRVKFVCPSCGFSNLGVPSAAGQLAHVPCGNRVMVAQ